MDSASDIQTPDKASGIRTLAEQAYHRLRHGILSGELPAGEKLRLEALSERYAIGMSPLREALSRLVGDSLVVTEGQRGFWVAPLSIKEFDDITRVRGLVEAEALYLSIAQGDEAWEEHVREKYQVLSEVEARMQHEAGLASQFEEANREFHEVIISACDSPWLLRLASTLYQQSERYRRVALAISSTKRSVHDEHEALVNAALARNGLKACRVLELHLNATADVVRAALATREQEKQPRPRRRRAKA